MYDNLLTPLYPPKARALEVFPELAKFLLLIFVSFIVDQTTPFQSSFEVSSEPLVPANVKQFE